MSAVAPDADAANQRRISIREVGEVAYRSLVAVGASHGEATQAAQQVTHAEVQFGVGLQALVTELHGGRWLSSPIHVVDSELPGGRRRRRLSSAQQSLLRLAPTSAEIAACHPGGTATLIDGVQLGPIIDQVLLAAADAGGTVIAAVQQAEHQRVAVRVATPEGHLGTGTLTRLCAPWTDLPEWLPGACVAVIGGLEADAPLDWLSRAVLACARRAAARNGVPVAACTWDEAYGASRRYLVPES